MGTSQPSEKLKIGNLHNFWCKLFYYFFILIIYLIFIHYYFLLSLEMLWGQSLETYKEILVGAAVCPFPFLPVLGPYMF